MLELLDPKKLDEIAYEGGLLARMREFSLLEGKRIGWHYVMDYTWLATRFAVVYKPGMRVVDIGCGPGAVHGFLEAEFGVDILGIDMERWEKDYVDLKGNFTVIRRFGRRMILGRSPLILFFRGARLSIMRRRIIGSWWMFAWRRLSRAGCC